MISSDGLPPLRLAPLPAFIPPDRLDEIAHVRQTVGWVQEVIDAFAPLCRAMAEAVRQIIEAFHRIAPALLLVVNDEGARYARRMEAHYHRTAGRPRSRRRPGRCRR